MQIIFFSKSFLEKRDFKAEKSPHGPSPWPPLPPCGLTWTIWKPPSPLTGPRGLWMTPYKHWTEKVKIAINNVCSSSCVIASILLFFTHYEFSAQPSLSIFVNAKILIVSYKISIFAFRKAVLKQRYLEMIAPLLFLDCTMHPPHIFDSRYYA